jgi:hypothetical protein
MSRNGAGHKHRLSGKMSWSKSAAPEVIQTPSATSHTIVVKGRTA